MAEEEDLVDYEEDDETTDKKTDGKEIKKCVNIPDVQYTQYFEYSFVLFYFPNKRNDPAILSHEETILLFLPSIDMYGIFQFENTLCVRWSVSLKTSACYYIYYMECD